MLYRGIPIIPLLMLPVLIKKFDFTEYKSNKAKKTLRTN